MSRHFSVTEPHPTVPKSGVYLAGGRGGAGNYHKYKPEDLTVGPNAVGPASRLPLHKQSPRYVAIGRGGAGNHYTASEAEPVFQFDEEMVTRREAHAPVYHIGRGGAANFVDEKQPRSQRNYSTGSSGSTTSNDSVRRGLETALNKIQQKLGRQ